MYTQDGFVATWVEITLGHSQLVSIIEFVLNTSPTSQEDLQLLKTERTDKDTVKSKINLLTKPRNIALHYTKPFTNSHSVFSLRNFLTVHWTNLALDKTLIF